MLAHSLPQLLLDVFFLARAIEGEGCMQMLQPQECATWLVHSVLNRTEKSWWPDSIQEQVKRYYHGYGSVPTPSEQAVAMALSALAQEKRVHGFCFVVSDFDFAMHPSWDRKLIRRSFWDLDSKIGLHFLSDWPEEDGK